MRIGAQSNTPLSITQSGIEMTIVDVENFAYLGTVITKDGGANDDVNARINKASHAIRRLNKSGQREIYRDAPNSECFLQV